MMSVYVIRTNRQPEGQLSSLWCVHSVILLRIFCCPCAQAGAWASDLCGIWQVPSRHHPTLLCRPSHILFGLRTELHSVSPKFHQKFHFFFFWQGECALWQSFPSSSVGFSSLHTLYPWLRPSTFMPRTFLLTAFMWIMSVFSLLLVFIVP